jgi:hypothetical protein
MYKAPHWRLNRDGKIAARVGGLQRFKSAGTMPFLKTRALLAVLCAVSISTAAFAQSGGKEPEPAKPNAAEITKESQKKIDEIAEAGRVVAGPAGQPECVWVGRRVVALLWRDDLDTAIRHLELYDRFGCPGAHIQATFRCLIRQGALDPKAQDTLNGRVHACWLNPALQPLAAAAAAPAEGSAPAQAGQAAPAQAR